MNKIGLKTSKNLKTQFFFRWNNEDKITISEVSSYKQDKGMDDFAEDLGGLHTYLLELMNGTRHLVTQTKHTDVPLYVLGTGGYRNGNTFCRLNAF